jgi:SAM-dependent methyltransferase
MRSPPAYVLGLDDAEIARLDTQSAAIAPATAQLLRLAGIGPGMRVLELGTGLGDVAFAIADLVGPEGSVVGLDQAQAALDVAERRREAAGLDHVRFVAADVRSHHVDEPFHAIVARLLLFHLPDAVDVVRHHIEALRPGGLALAIDFDLGTVRAEPPVALVDTAIRWVEAGFRSAGADPRVGARLGAILEAAGLVEVETIGLQRYFRPPDPTGPRLLSGVVKALAAPIAANGIATPEEMGLETLEARLAAELAASDSAMLPPAVVGAWGRRPGTG